MYKKSWSYAILFLRYVRDGCNCYFSFGLFFALYPPNSPKNENFKKMKKPLETSSFQTSVPKLWSYGIRYWDTAHDRYNCYFLFWAIFFPFTPLTWPKNKDFEKMKKTSGDIILQNCIKNHDHMLYCSWDMACDGCNCYFSFWAFLCPFTPLTAQKIKISQKWKKHLEISSFYTCILKIMIRWCMVPEKWCVMDGQTDRKSNT